MSLEDQATIEVLRWQLAEAEKLCIAIYLAHGRRLGPDEEAKIAAMRAKHGDRP
jgi:hypothetical protein